MKTLATKLFVCLALLSPTIAMAEKATLDVECYKTEVVIRELTETHKETPIILGSRDNGPGNISVWVNEAAGTSTTVISLKSGHSCIVAASVNTKFAFGGKKM